MRWPWRLLFAVPLLTVVFSVESGRVFADDAADEVPEAPAPTAEELERRRKQHRQDLELRKGDLEDASRPALEVLERFRRREFRLWRVPLQRIVRMGKAAVPALLIMLEETDWEVRAFAAAALEAIAPPEARGPLIAALAKEEFVEARRRMVRALAALRDPEARSALAAAAKDADPGIVLAAVRGLGALQLPEAAETLRTFVRSEDLDVRYEALGSLAALGDGDAIARLEKAADAMVATPDLRRTDSVDPFDLGDRYEQYLVGYALARAGTKEVDDRLEDVLTARKPWDKKSFLRLGAAEGLGRRSAATGEMPAILLEGLDHDDALVRVASSYGLRFARHPDLLRPLVRALKDSQLDVRTNVVRAIGHLGTEKAAEELRKPLRDSAPEVRIAAVQALGEIPGEAATEPLLRALRDAKYVIRVQAAALLGARANEPGVAEGLAKAARTDDDYGVREQALASLSQATGRLDEALPALIDRAADRDPGVRANASLGVAALLDGLPEAPALEEPFLRRVVGMALDPELDREERAAIELLDALRPSAAVPLLIGALDDRKSEVRHRALSLLQRISETTLETPVDGSATERKEGIARWEAWWAEAGTLPRRDRILGMVVTGPLSEQVRDLKWRGLDVALLLDSTGSMAGLLRLAKQSIDDLIREMASPIPSLRIALVTYRDFGDNYVYYGTPLTFDLEHLPGFLQSFVHGQGGDIPEAVHDTVTAVMRKLDWRPDAHKVIVFAGDAPHHPEQDSAFRAAIRAWAKPENRAVLHAIFTDTNRRSIDIPKRRRREDPDDFQHPFLDIYRSIAKEGRGIAVVLSDESVLVKEMLVLAFGPAWRSEIETYLDFRN